MDVYGNWQYGPENNVSEMLLYLLEIELSWKAHLTKSSESVLKNMDR